MKVERVILVFDIGKTNKKTLLFNEEYEIVYESTAQFDEIKDEHDFPCEDIHALTAWVKKSFDDLHLLAQFKISAVNISAYGASFVYVDEALSPILPLYNYLKPFPEEFKKSFYESYGGDQEFPKVTASPILGSLNSGMQLLRLKYEQPEAFSKVKWALHLPQYLSSILSQQAYSEITSIGCHTNLWDFNRSTYHKWVSAEDVIQKLPALTTADTCVTISKSGKDICIGSGLHDSSAAMIPYLTSLNEPFVLISTGTWCISLNPFNKQPLTSRELGLDCLCYLTFQGAPVKASRLFAGYEHEQQVKRMSAHFKVLPEEMNQITFDPNDLPTADQISAPFADQSLDNFRTVSHAYHALVSDIVEKQIRSTELILHGSNVRRIFVDGGFSKNEIYMNLLAAGLSEYELFAACVPHASALGAAIAIHASWNKKNLPSHLISPRYYSSVKKTTDSKRK